LSTRLQLSLLLCLALGGLFATSPAQAVELSRAGGAALPGFVTPGHWAEVGFSVTNPGNSDITVYPTVRFQRGEEVQFVSRFWVPAGATREGLQPVRCPPLPRNANAQDVKALDIETSLLDEQNQLRGRQPGLLRIEHRPNGTGILMGGSDRRTASRWVAQTRVKNGRTKRLAYIRRESLPERNLGLDALSEIVLGDPELSLTAGQRDALRDWVVAGGTLWLMLDQLPAGMPERLLGDAWTVTVLGRNEINQPEVRFEDERSTRSFDYPIGMVWVDPGDFSVIATVDAGSPALMERDLGLGRVVVSTVDAAAWMTADDELLPAASDMARTVLDRVATPEIDEALQNRVASGQIGYEILDRGTVLVGLGLYLAVLIAGGLWFAARQQLDRLAVLAAAAAAVVTLGFGVMGIMTRSAVPPTVAGTPMLAIEPAVNREVITGRVSVYNPAAADKTLAGTNGTLLWPDQLGLHDVDPRMVWTDVDAHHWESLTLASGAVRGLAIRQGRSRRAQPASMNFADDAIEVTTPAGLADVILATPTGGLVPQAVTDAAAEPGDDSRAWRGGAPDAVRNGRYIRGGTLSIEQQRRLGLYRAVSRGFPASGQVVMGWDNALPLDVAFPFEVTPRHDALVVMPARMERPSVGTQVTVPEPLVTYEVVSRKGVGVSTVFNPQTREWIGDVTQGMTILLAFYPPRDLLPMQVDRLTLNLDLDAPSRTVQIGTLRGQQVTPARTLESPTSPVAMELTAEQVPGLTFEPDGSVLVAIRIADPPVGQLATTWRVKRVGADITGTIRSEGQP